MRPVAGWAQSRPACLSTADPKTTTGTSWNGAAHMDTEALSPSSPAAGKAQARHGACTRPRAGRRVGDYVCISSLHHTDGSHPDGSHACQTKQTVPRLRMYTQKRYVFARQLGRRKGYGRVHCYGETARAWNVCKDSGRGWPGAAGHYRSRFFKMALQKSFLYMAGSCIS